MKKDYYEILGVSKNATKDEIKKAFHKAAHKHHPDKNGGDDKKFKEANEAYQTLSDDSKKAQYDRFGSDYQQYGGGNGQGFDPNGFGFDFSGFQGAGQGFDMGDLGDVFSDFFGGGQNPGRRAQRGRDISTQMSISFEESIFGVEKEISIMKTCTCNECNGNGAKVGTKTKQCSTCHGQGQIRENRQTILGVIATNKICTNCDGFGEIPEEKCTTCKGYGTARMEKHIKVQIPSGINNGETLGISGQGEAIRRGQSGDLYIRVSVTPHKTFKREGNNLVYQMTIKLTDALLGGEHTITTFDGDLTVKIPQGISHGEVLRVKEKGVPQGKTKRGDLLIPIKISIPQKLTKKSKELIEALLEEGL